MAEKTFEEAVKRLEEIVRNLESGDLSLEASLEAFEEGMKLVTFCSGKLEEAEKKVSILVEESGKYKEIAFEPDQEAVE